MNRPVLDPKGFLVSLFEAAMQLIPRKSSIASFCLHQKDGPSSSGPTKVWRNLHAPLDGRGPGRLKERWSLDIAMELPAKRLRRWKPGIPFQA